MGTGQIVLYVYLSGLVCTFAALALIMKSRLDKFDWHFDKDKYITLLIAGSLFWFVFWFLAKKNLKSLIATDEDGYAAKSRLRANLPPCSERISYKPKTVDNKETFGEFIFDAYDIEDCLLRKIDNNQHLYHDDEGALLEWVRQSDTSIIERSEVPKLWGRFKYIADELIRENLGEIYCSACGKSYTFSDLITDDDKHRPGWNRNRIHCPANHNLISLRTAHYHYGSV